MKTTRLVRGAAVAALYVVLTLVMQPIAFHTVQFRLSECLTLLPFIFPETVLGLTIGCLVSNILGGTILDIVFGTLATLLAAFLTSKAKHIWTAALPPVIINALVVGTYLSFAAGAASFGLYSAAWLSIFVSEAAVCFCVGIPLVYFISKSKSVIFK